MPRAQGTVKGWLLIGQARDKSLLLSHCLASSMDLHTHPAAFFGRSFQLKSGLHKAISSFDFSPRLSPPFRGRLSS